MEEGEKGIDYLRPWLLNIQVSILADEEDFSVGSCMRKESSPKTSFTWRETPLFQLDALVFFRV